MYSFSDLNSLAPEGNLSQDAQKKVKFVYVQKKIQYCKTVVLPVKKNIHNGTVNKHLGYRAIKIQEKGNYT